MKTIKVNHMVPSLPVLQVFMILHGINKNAASFIVGGWVRDELRGIAGKDVDIVTDIPLDTVEAAFTEAGWEVKDTGKVFLVTNVSKDGCTYEIANFRKDSKTSDGRRPSVVEIGTIMEDAARRDFTVNALYFDPWTGTVIDPTGQGLDDLDKGVLRFVGRAKDRIKEDYLRVFRFYRFIKKGFTPNRNTLRVVREMFADALSKLPAERIRDEIEKAVSITWS